MEECLSKRLYLQDDNIINNKHYKLIIRKIFII
jgi:hypothetical protein